MRRIKSEKKEGKKPAGPSSISSLFGRFHGKLLPGEKSFDARRAMDEILHERWADFGCRKEQA